MIHSAIPKMPRLFTSLIIGSFWLPFLSAQSISAGCTASLTASYPTPSVANGFQAKLVANKLTRPRSIIFDTNGHLLVVQAGYGITSLTLKDDGSGCMSVSSKKDVIVDSSVSVSCSF
jgi:hypothetical protein